MSTGWRPRAHALVRRGRRFAARRAARALRAAPARDAAVVLVDAGTASAADLDRTLQLLCRARRRGLRIRVLGAADRPDALAAVVQRYRPQGVASGAGGRGGDAIAVAPGRRPDPVVLARLLRQVSPTVAEELAAAAPTSEEPFGRMPNPVPRLAAWMSAVEEGRAVLRGRPDDEDVWSRLVLAHDAADFLEAVERMDDEEWSGLRASLLVLAPDVEHPRWAALPWLVRVGTWLATRGRRADLERLVVGSRFDDGQVRTSVHGDVVRVESHRDQPGLEDVPEHLWHLDESRTALRACVRRARWVGDVLEVELLAYAAQVETSGASVRWRVHAVSGGASVDLPVEVSDDPAVSRWSRERHTGHDRGLLTVRLDPLAVLAGQPSVVIELELRVGDLRRRGRVDEVDAAGSWPFLQPRSVHGLEVRLEHDAGDGLRLLGRPAPGAAVSPPPPPAVTVLGAEVSTGQITLRCATSPSPADPRAWEVRLEGPRCVLPGDVRVDGGELVVDFSTTVDRWGRTQPAPTDAYLLRVCRDGARERPAVAPAVAERLPEDTLTEHHRVRLRGTPGGDLRLVLSAPLRSDELGPRAQQLLREATAVTGRTLDPGLVYLQAYTGQSATDSPLALHGELRRRRPDLRLVWAVADRSSWVPEGAETVLWRSAAWYRVMATAGCVVTNIELEPWFTPDPRQLVVQTFHGYPSKSMGIRLWRAKDFTDSRIEQQLDRTSRTWGLLLTPTPEMDRYYREEYRYEGEILAAGYPRDDDLVSAGAEETRRRARRQLGVGPDQRLVLYAPTWRDDLATNHRAARMQTDLDVDRLAEGLGPGYVVALRGHRFHLRAARPGSSSRVADVTDHPEINDLVLACDAAVLDYSSLRFDMALAGRPMVFLVPDLDGYTRSTRGFLYDFRGSAPGKLVGTTEEVLTALLDLEGLRAAHAGEVRAFNARYNRLNDGRAAERVVDRVLALLDERHPR